MHGTRYDCVVPSPDGTRLMLVREDGAWTLPHVFCERGWLAEVVEELADKFRERYGVDAGVLRILQWLPENVTCELEARAGAAADAMWVLPRDPIVDALPRAQADGIRNWIADRGHERVPSPWQRRGWIDEARAWIGSRVDAEEIRQVKAGWNGSCVLRVKTRGETFYFKAAKTAIPGEAAIIRALAEFWPEHVPSIVDVDPARNWMLMRELQGTPLCARDARDLADVARLVARIQIGEAQHVDRWLALGCPDRGLDAFESSFHVVLHELPRHLRDSGVITEAERETIASFDAASKCRALASYAIPPLSIFHEDFRDGNAQRLPDGSVALIDWNEVVLGHPFFIAQRFLWYMQVPPGKPRYAIGEGDDDALRRAFRDAYLEEFSAFEPLVGLHDAFRLSMQLSPVYDVYCLAARQSLDAIFERELLPEEKRIARAMMNQLLEVCGASSA